MIDSRPVARLVDLAEAPPVRTQTLYHSIAECAGPDDPVTICLVRPAAPYVSIGFHQDAHEVDLAFCRARGLPVIRRRVGGGVVLLDRHQIFFQIIVPRDRLSDLGLPSRIGGRYPILLEPVVSAYRRLGLDARFHPPADVRVRGRKICGTGAGDVGDAFVFVGNLLLDFDHALMARILAFEDGRIRSVVRRSIERGVTTARAELGEPLWVADVRAALVESFAAGFGLELHSGDLTPVETARAEAMDAEFVSEDWLHEVRAPEGRARRLAVHSGEGFLEVRENGGGLALHVVEGRIDDLLLSGDLSALEPEVAGRVRAALVGASIDAAAARFEALSPFPDGVGRLVRILIEEGRRA